MELTKETFQKEVSQFRAQLQEGAADTAEKSIRLEKKGPVAVIVLDQFQERANKLSSANMLRLFDLFTQIEEDDSVGALVIVSRKPRIFVAGADINEIQKFGKMGSGADALMKLQAVFTYLERLKKPSIAAIHGACMGGGTEMSLACDYRIASDAPETKIGLPEVMLGVIPGWGGTQRMPRLIGLEKSLDLILSGRAIDGKKAKKFGLVDRVVAGERIEEIAVAWATELAAKKTKRLKEADYKDRLLEMVPGGRWIIFDQAKKALLAKTKGQYPAPLKALEVIRRTYGGDLQAGLKVEAEAFMEMVGTVESRNLISLYFLNERTKKDKGGTATPRKVENAGVLGAGVMGGGIAQLFADKGVRVRMKDLDWKAIARGFHAAEKVFAKKRDRKKMTQFDFDNAMARIEGTTQYTGFKNLDLVVEAIVEDLEIKKKALAELERHVGPQTVIASNTSSLSISQIATGLRDPSRLVGMHFFNPVDKMPLVEVIRGKESSEEAVTTVFGAAKAMGKTAILVKDSPGFVVNRILAMYLVEGIHLLEEGVEMTRIDRVAEKFGMPMGPLGVLDEVGLDVVVKIIKILYGAFGERLKPPPMISWIDGDKKTLGKKSGVGLYVYEGKDKKPNPAIVEKLRAQGNAKAGARIDDAIIEKRLFYGMVNEAARCVEEELVRDVSDIDVGMIFGTGFPPFRGGVLRWADNVGAEAIVSELEVFTRNYGVRFQPATLLQQLAVGKKKFYGDK